MGRAGKWDTCHENDGNLENLVVPMNHVSCEHVIPPNRHFPDAPSERWECYQGTSKDGPVGDLLSMESDVSWFRRGLVGVGSAFLAS